MEIKNIYQRINAVMKSVTYVQKDKAVSGGGANYKAVTHDQVISVARKALVENGVMIYPTQISGEFLVMRDMNAQPEPVKMGLYSGTYIIAFVNIDDGKDRIEVTVQAHANDNGDKAPGKSLTYATKSAILKVLCLETGENDESRADANDLDFITIEQQVMLGELLLTKEGNVTPMLERISRKYKFSNFSEVKSKHFDEILKAAQQCKS